MCVCVGVCVCVCKVTLVNMTSHEAAIHMNKAE